MYSNRVHLKRTTTVLHRLYNALWKMLLENTGILLIETRQVIKTRWPLVECIYNHFAITVTTLLNSGMIGSGWLSIGQDQLHTTTLAATTSTATSPVMLEDNLHSLGLLYPRT